MEDLDSESGGLFGALEDEFQEPEGYFKKDRAPQTQEVVVKGQKFNLRVIGEHSLWGNYIWNASKCIGKYLFEKPDTVKGKSVLELGAGAGLPSLASAMNGAKYVCITDFPDEKLLENIQINVDGCLSKTARENVDVLGYLWNTDTSKLLHKTRVKKFDVIILSDLIFNHSKHTHIIESCIKCGTPGSKILIGFSHHIPVRKKYDLEIFEVMKKYKFKTQKIGEFTYEEMFPEDPGDLEERKTVYLYQANFCKESMELLKKE